MNIEKMLDYLKQVGLDIINKVGVLLDRAKGVVESVNIINEDGNMKEGIGKVSESTSILFDFLNFFKDIISGKSGGISYIFNFYNDFIKYLDSLTLLQESALLHMLMFTYIICTLFTIIGVFFGNELINYLDLENKNRYLSSFLKIRARLQRYYLIWTIFMLFVVCLVGLFLNLLAFIAS